jgi:ATP sulfurylase
MESMIVNPFPTRAEVNDVYNTLYDAADGLVLAAETAIGKYPIQCTTMIKRITDQFNSDEKNPNLSMDRLNQNSSFILIEPHGGVLVDRINNDTDVENINRLTKLDVDLSVLMDAEQIAIGTFSPITGFMNKEEIDSTLFNYQLPNNIVWPLPIFLQIDKENYNRFEIGESISLTLNNTQEVYAVLEINDLFKYDLNVLSNKMFGTDDLNHPGVKRLMSKGNFFVGGDIQLIKRIPSNLKYYEFTPSESRLIFEHKGWNRVVGFHTRNVPHRVHEHIQIEALEKFNCDGVFIHPVVGQKKKGDFQHEIILKAYNTLINQFFPKGKFLLSAFQSYSRYAGPREAVFTALCRKNFGCSHFIIGRDHTGVGNYYSPNDSHKFLEKIGDIGIKLVVFDAIKYSANQKRYISERDINYDNNEKHLNISGSEARRMFNEGKQPPDWFMRKEVSKMILENITSGNEIFVK